MGWKDWKEQIKRGYQEGYDSEVQKGKKTAVEQAPAKDDIAAFTEKVEAGDAAAQDSAAAQEEMEDRGIPNPNRKRNVFLIVGAVLLGLVGLRFGLVGGVAGAVLGAATGYLLYKKLVEPKQ